MVIDVVTLTLPDGEFTLWVSCNGGMAWRMWNWAEVFVFLQPEDHVRVLVGRITYGH